jgi:hypothetical protein
VLVPENNDQLPSVSEPRFGIALRGRLLFNELTRAEIAHKTRVQETTAVIGAPGEGTR